MPIMSIAAFAKFGNRYIFVGVAFSFLAVFLLTMGTDRVSARSRLIWPKYPLDLGEGKPGEIVEGSFQLVGKCTNSSNCNPTS